MKVAWAGLTCVVLTAACSSERAAPTPPPTTVPATLPPTRPTDEWLGRWNGVEGTYLELAREADGYTVTIANLDGPRTYAGTAAGDRVEFARNGRTESIRRATGKETGMKWLADEMNCLVVTVGSEGFCR